MISQDLIKIGADAKQRRKFQGLSQAEVATRIQAHRNEISRIENGKYTGNLATFIRYLNLLGLSLQTKVSRHPQLHDLDSLFNEEDE